MFITTKDEILLKLHKLDDSLVEPLEIVICGSCSMLLQDIDFRKQLILI